MLISPYPDQEGNKLGSMAVTRAVSTISRRELSSSIFFSPLQGKAPKEIHAILTETACFLPGRANYLSATCICVYINGVANGGVLHLYVRHYFVILRVSPHPPMKNFGRTPGV